MEIIRQKHKTALTEFPESGTISVQLEEFRLAHIDRACPIASHGKIVLTAKRQARVTVGSRVSGPAPRRRGERTGKISSPINRSELNHGQTGDSLEIAEVRRRDLVAKMQCRRCNQQILKCKLGSGRFLLAFDVPSQSRGFTCRFARLTESLK